MLENTFIHIPGIGEKTEQMLWGRGILTWSDFLNYNGLVFSKGRDSFVRDELKTSIKRKNDISFFKRRLSNGEMWRLFEAFNSRIVYLDIETSGGYQGIDEITVIGIYDGINVRSFVSGVDLEEFEMAIEPYDLMATFNGTCFDIPYIRRQFTNISLPPAHIDLRFVLKRLGYRGGLKKIEKELGLARVKEIDGMNGYHAVMLWQEHQWGGKGALDKLLKYNTADIVNLKPLMETAYRKMTQLLLPSKIMA
jgi:uncharacterized protein